MSHSPTELATLPTPAVAGEGAESLQRVRQYELLLDTTTQMLVTAKLHERLLLALEAVTTSLGYPQAAIALVDERKASLSMRAAFGFATATGCPKPPLASARSTSAWNSAASKARRSITSCALPNSWAWRRRGR
jgi:hypothetical protein